MRLLIVIFMCMTSFISHAQSFEKPKHFYRVLTENDFWNFGNKTDRYYTQGLKLEYGKTINTEKLKGLPISLKESTNKILGFSLGQNIYTPTNISIPEIMVDDRPYASWTYLSTFLVSNNSVKKHRLSSELFLGVIGPMSKGDFIQTQWHKLIKSQNPEGWNHQIGNDIGINYLSRFEFSILEYKSHKKIKIDAVPVIEAQLGSVFNNLSLGLLANVSLFNANNYFNDSFNEPVGRIIKSTIRNHTTKPTTQSLKPNFIQSLKLSNINIFGRPQIRGVAYNAMLQGGIFNRNNVHYISADDIERIYFDLNYGITWSTYYFDISYSKAYRTKEFTSQKNDHKWGQFILSVKH